MKKLLVTLAFILTGLVGYSQIPKQQILKDFSTWSITPHIGFSYENTDMVNNDPFYTSTPLHFGYGLELSKQLSHFTSLQLNGFQTSLGSDEYLFGFKTDIQQFDIRFRFNMTNGALFKKWQSTQLYTYIGYGALWYNAKQTYNNQYPLENHKGITRVIPVGVGVKYRTGNRTSLSLDLSYNHTNTDNLDAWSNGVTSRDGYTRANIGFTFNLNKKRILEWDHPWQYLVPESVHDTTTVIQRIEVAYTPPKVEPVKYDTAVIYFVPGSAEIEMPYMDKLDHVIARAATGEGTIHIESYCDSTGTTKTNLQLIAKRALKVIEYVKLQVPEDKISVSVYDESHAVYLPNARNRKVIVRLVK